MKRTIRNLVCLAIASLFTLGGLGAFPGIARSQSPAKQASPKTPAPNPADDLAIRQDKLASKYSELEKLLLRMAEYDSATNPRRAALLKQAAVQSADHLTKAKLATIAKLLNTQQFKKAIDSQTDVQADLKLLLTLLQSENENANRKSEQQKIKEYIKEIQRLARLQGSLKARTEQTEDPQALAKEQSSVADQATKVKEQIADEGEQTSKPEDAQPSSDGEKPGDPKASEKSAADKAKDQSSKESGKENPGEKNEDSKGEQKSESAPGEQKAPSEEGKEGEKSPSPSQEGEPKTGESKKSQPGQGGKESPMPQEDAEKQPAPPQEEPEQEQPQADQKPPAQKRVEAAEKRMREAQKKLEQAKRDEAVKDQQKAEEELKKAVAELEEILKQLREEEIEQTLADLATRFKKMLEMQLKVNESTAQLVNIPADKRGREVDLQSTRLSSDQQKILGEAQKALALLGDEGSSTAFPATVEQLCQDMQQVVERLALVKIDPITIGIEDEVAQTLEQLVAALEQEQKEREKKKQQEEKESPAPQEQPGEDPLIDQIAELKMIRSLQQRINSRTKTYAKLLDQPDDPVGKANTVDLEAALLQLSKREAEVFRVTRDIVVGRKQ